MCYFRGFGWRGWCEGGPNTEPPGEHAVSRDECWEKCASVYVDLVSVDYWPNGIEAYPGVGPCWCQTSCTHITFDYVTESQYPELAIVSGAIPADSGLVCSEPSAAPTSSLCSHYEAHAYSGEAFPWGEVAWSERLGGGVHDALSLIHI